MQTWQTCPTDACNPGCRAQLVPFPSSKTSIFLPSKPNLRKRLQTICTRRAKSLIRLFVGAAPSLFQHEPPARPLPLLRTVIARPACRTGDKGVDYRAPSAAGRCGRRRSPSTSSTGWDYCSSGWLFQSSCTISRDIAPISRKIDSDDISVYLSRYPALLKYTSDYFGEGF